MSKLTEQDLQRMRADAQRGMGASSEATLQLVAMAEKLEADLGLLHIKLDEISKQSTDQAAAGNDKPLTCDYCGAETDNPWHGSVMLNGKENRHIHACDKCVRKIQKPACRIRKGGAA